MRASIRAMTLQTILRRHGITTIKELTHRSGLSRQQNWRLWHGYDGVGKATALRLHERLGIPLEELLQVDPVPARKRTPRQPANGRRATAKPPRPARFGWSDGDLTITPPPEEAP
jgi:transcriptional regulator with XRE-family HTH domain